METLETLYAGMFNEHDNIEAARGCNQYKHKQGCDENEDAPIKHKLNVKPLEHAIAVGSYDRDKSPRLRYKEAVDLTDDIFEIALEEGGYEKLYDTPKNKLKHAITQELMVSGTKDMFGNEDTGDSGETAKYKWWRKNTKKVLDRI